MAQLQLKQIGYLAKVHGINGELVLNLTENLTFDLIDEMILEGDAVFVDRDGIPVPFFIAEDGIRELNQNAFLIKFDDIDAKKANSLISSKVWIESEKLDESEQAGFDDASEWIGFTVSDSKKSFKGKVIDFIALKGNPMLSIDMDGKNLLLPLISDFITEVNEKKKTICVQLPEGYLDAML